MKFTIPSSWNADHHPLDYSPDGKMLAVVTNGQRVCFYDAESGQLQRYHQMDEQPSTVYVLADGERVAVNCKSSVRIYKIADGVVPAPEIAP